MIKSYKIEGMSCGGCEANIRNIAQRHGANDNIIVDRHQKIATFEVKGSFDEESFLKGVQDAGFDIEVWKSPEPQQLAAEIKPENTW